MPNTHTPGPWIADRNKRGGWSVYTAAGMYNVLDHTAPVEFVGEVAWNARLIAAAPEMLDMIVRMLATLEVASIADKSLYASPLAVSARALLAKIEGKE